jgi:two-component system chemotaxis response regulator CheY
MSTRILTVDDSKMVRLIVAKTFQPQGCEVYEAGNGLDGLAIAESIQPNLIFLDITMADMNGLEVLERLRKIPSLAATPVVMLTAESGMHSIERADQLKVVGYVAKPFKGEKLLAIAAKFLQSEPVAAT